MQSGAYVGGYAAGRLSDAGIFRTRQRGCVKQFAQDGDTCYSRFGTVPESRLENPECD
jgi:hypothetical protein